MISLGFTGWKWYYVLPCLTCLIKVMPNLMSKGLTGPKWCYLQGDYLVRESNAKNLVFGKKWTKSVLFPKRVNSTLSWHLFCYFKGHLFCSFAKTKVATCSTQFETCFLRRLSKTWQAYQVMPIPAYLNHEGCPLETSELLAYIFWEYPVPQRPEPCPSDFDRSSSNCLRQRPSITLGAGFASKLHPSLCYKVRDRTIRLDVPKRPLCFMNQ